MSFPFRRGHIQRMPTEPMNMFIHLAVWSPVVIDTILKFELNSIRMGYFPKDCQEIFSDTQIQTSK